MSATRGKQRRKINAPPHIGCGNCRHDFFLSTGALAESQHPVFAEPFPDGRHRSPGDCPAEDLLPLATRWLHRWPTSSDRRCVVRKSPMPASAHRRASWADVTNVFDALRSRPVDDRPTFSGALPKTSTAEPSERDPDEGVAFAAAGAEHVLPSWRALFASLPATIFVNTPLTTCRFGDDTVCAGDRELWNPYDPFPNFELLFGRPPPHPRVTS